jgi:hypothetical protein
MNNSCPNCGTNAIPGAAACPVCGAALPPGAAWPNSATPSAPRAARPFFLIAGIVTVLVVLVALAGIGGLLVYLKSGRAAAPGLAGLTPQQIGRFQRISTHSREALPPGATDALNATYYNSKGTDTVGIRLVEFPDPEQTLAYAQSRVSYFENRATIQQRAQVKNEDGSTTEKIIMKEDAGTDIESEVIISNNKSVVLIATGMPYGTATELISKIRF